MRTLDLIVQVLLVINLYTFGLHDYFTGEVSEDGCCFYFLFSHILVSAYQIVSALIRFSTISIQEKKREHKKLDIYIFIVLIYIIVFSLGSIILNRVSSDNLNPIIIFYVLILPNFISLFYLIYTYNDLKKSLTLKL